MVVHTPSAALILFQKCSLFDKSSGHSMYVFLRINLSTVRDILSSTDNGSNITAMMRFLPFSMHSFLAICSSNSHQALFKKFLLRTMMVFRLDSIAFKMFSSIASPGMKSRLWMQSRKRVWSIVSTSPSLMSIFSYNSSRTQSRSSWSYETKASYSYSNSSSWSSWYAFLLVMNLRQKNFTSHLWRYKIPRRPPRQWQTPVSWPKLWQPG